MSSWITRWEGKGERSSTVTERECVCVPQLACKQVTEDEVYQRARIRAHDRCPFAVVRLRPRRARGGREIRLLRATVGAALPHVDVCVSVCPTIYTNFFFISYIAPSPPEIDQVFGSAPPRLLTVVRKNENWSRRPGFVSPLSPRRATSPRGFHAHNTSHKLSACACGRECSSPRGARNDCVAGVHCRGALSDPPRSIRLLT